MFSLFGGRKKDAKHSLNDKERVIVGACSAVLGMNYELIEHRRDKSQDNFSLGYVWGFTDCFLQRNGYEPSGKAFAIITIVFLNVFGIKEGTDLIARAFHLQEGCDDAMQRGMMAGGNDVIAWMKSKKDPTGWLAYAIGGNSDSVGT